MAKIGISKNLTKASAITVGLFVFLTMLACNDSENNNIPLVEVNFQLNINDPAYLELQTIGGAVEIFGGSRGIILYRSSENEIRAYDRHCTFQPSSTCALVSIDPNRFTGSDNCCGSIFLLTDGSVSSPPATFPLKSYQTIFDGTFLSVTN